MKTIKAGEVVKVYCKPITGQELEGKAKLVELVRPDDGDGLSLWKVEFADQPGDLYYRTINAEYA